jgi:hypothetical protein
MCRHSALREILLLSTSESYTNIHLCRSGVFVRKPGSWTYQHNEMDSSWNGEKGLQVIMHSEMGQHGQAFIGTQKENPMPGGEACQGADPKSQALGRDHFLTKSNRGGLRTNDAFHIKWMSTLHTSRNELEMETLTSHPDKGQTQEAMTCRVGVLL